MYANGLTKSMSTPCNLIGTTTGPYGVTALAATSAIPVATSRRNDLSLASPSKPWSRKPWVSKSRSTLAAPLCVPDKLDTSARSRRRFAGGTAADDDEDDFLDTSARSRCRFAGGSAAHDEEDDFTIAAFKTDLSHAANPWHHTRRHHAIDPIVDSPEGICNRRHNRTHVDCRLMIDRKLSPNLHTESDDGSVGTTCTHHSEHRFGGMPRRCICQCWDLKSGAL
jgi:hypothetical protein